MQARKRQRYLRFMKANELEMMIVNGELKNGEIIKRMK